MSYSTDKEILDAISYTSQYIKDLFPIDCMVGVTDLEKFLVHYSGEKLNAKIEANTPISKDGAIYESIKTGQRIVKEVPADAYGYPFKSIAIPIRNSENQIIGSFTTGIDLSTQLELTDLCEQFASSFEQISSSTEELAASAQELNMSQQKVMEVAKATSEYLNKTGDIINLINEVASQTRLLGLNAAIEAARAGEQGRGFAVVSDEIRKLSEKTSSSTKEVIDILKKIDEHIHSLNEHMGKTEEIGNSQAAASEEISATIQQNTAMVEKLMEISKIL